MKLNLVDIEVGDKIAIRTHLYGRIIYKITTVERITKTLIITKDGRYRIKRNCGRSDCGNIEIIDLNEDIIRKVKISTLLLVIEKKIKELLPTLPYMPYTHTGFELDRITERIDEVSNLNIQLKQLREKSEKEVGENDRKPV